VHDESRLGALRLRDEQGIVQRPSEPGRRATPPLIELGDLLSATRAIETNSETAQDLEYLLGRATSLGGLRPKCSVRDADGALCIGKFPSVHDERAVTRAEVLALRLARAAGINAAEARVEESDGVPVALIRRFDRQGADRLHYVSAATLMQVRPDDPVEHAYTDVVDTIRRFSAAAADDITELWRRIAFSILINNTDDHLANHGFLHVERELWRLSPAFDVNPFPDRARELKTWISADAGPAASIDALRSIAPYCGLRDDDARRILGDVERAVATWRTVGAELGMSAFELDQFADAFEHDERAVARELAR
jgi:serine/threonine-protein kinase HipA